MNLSFFGPPFTALTFAEQLERVKNSRMLRRQKRPIKVKKAPAKKVKKQAGKDALLSLSKEDQIKLIKAALAQKG